MLSVEETRALSEVLPEFEPILHSDSPMLGALSLDTDIDMVREHMAHARQFRTRPDPASLPYTEEDIRIPVRDGRHVAARVYRPRGGAPAGGCPGFCVFHGGGYMLGDFVTEEELCARFTGLGGIAVNVDYRHAPEHVFPAAIEDAHDAMKWVSRNASTLGIDPSKGLLVGGDSSGGEIALVVAHLCRDDKMAPPLTGVYAAAPGGVNEQTVPEQYRHLFLSEEQNADAPVLTAESLQLINNTYKRDPCSPLGFPVAFPDHGGLPRTYVAVCGLDPVRDAGLIMERVCRDAGVETRLDVYAGVPHAFYALWPELEVSRKHARDSEAGLGWLLDR